MRGMLGVVVALCPLAGGADAPPALDDANVVFETPSPDSSGAVPIGNGEVGASV